MPARVFLVFQTGKGYFQAQRRGKSTRKGMNERKTNESERRRSDARRGEENPV